MQSCILYQNADACVTLLDIPRSIEEAQGGISARLISSSPMEHPYPGVEPKSKKASENLGESTLDELLLQKHLEFALLEAKDGLGNDKTWCLPRIAENQPYAEHRDKKRKRSDQESSPHRSPRLLPIARESDGNNVILPDNQDGIIHYHNPHPSSLGISLGGFSIKMPPKSTVLQGDVALTTDTFMNAAPRFDFIIMDPPWPNRSARRKKSYGIAYGTREISNILFSLPIQSHLSKDGIVAVWVTNKSAFREMLLGEGGLFAKWGLCLVEEWIWLKITSRGEPICPLDSRWRKPYEIVLVGRRIEGEKNKEEKNKEEDIKRRIIIGVPDLHSRKPNLSCLVQQVIGKQKGSYEALEIFARNLTAGWWAWGNEALKFQMGQYWQDIDEPNTPL
jgi:N6-adenosine-specific RNA methylase IME4